jgi:NitT/TauT family transport system permease protein
MHIPWLTRTVWEKRTGSWMADAMVVAAGLAVLYAVVVFARTWLGPFTPETEISLAPSALPLYASYSLTRMAVAYFLSLAFALAYGYAAAYTRAERFLLPLLDILQSIPVLSFLPGVMLALIALFPAHQMGLELGAILLIFTGQVWNMAFSFYSSLRSIPRELRDAARVYRYSWWQRFTQLELPYAAIGLVWNSMMSVAGGWFFLMACEMFVLGHRDFRLPGLGSYLQTAAAVGDGRAMLWGLGAMIGLIVMLDLLVWKPVIAWADKFKFEQMESAVAPRSALLTLLGRSPTLFWLRRNLFYPLRERLTLHFARKPNQSETTPVSVRGLWMGRALLAAGLLVILYGAAKAIHLLSTLTAGDLGTLFQGASATFLRVNLALLIGALWTIPLGVAIGFHPRLARIAQPLAQIAASVPATALFPVVLLILLQVGGGMELASLLLMLLGTQWYILFNVIAGAMAIPTDLKEVAEAFRFSRLQRWRSLILPGIFPYLVTGLVTAAGGAWNASIVAEYFHFRGQTLSTTGLGATISHATDSGNFDLLMAATILMAAIVVSINRLVWRRFYRLAHTRFKLEG